MNNWIKFGFDRKDEILKKRIVNKMFKKDGFKIKLKSLFIK